MKLYSENKNYKLYQGNMLDMLEVIEPQTIDSIVCDPPYELNFMGKGWDNSGIAFQPDTWRKCYDVLKPGGYLLAFGGSRTFHRIACAIEDAGFEIRDTIMWLYGCYSADTQVLTNQGWKYFYELDKTEKILQWNKDTNELTWLQPLNYFEYDIKDELIHYKNRHTDQLITKNHNVVCKVCKRRKQKEGFDFYKAEDIKKSWIIDFPLAGELKDGLHNDNAYIIGWWLTDAWKHKDGKACMFSQSKPKTLEKLRNYFNANNINYSEYTKKVKNIMHRQEHSFYVTGDLAKYLLTNYNDREMTWDFLTWDYDSRLRLIEGLIDGDGSDRKGQYSNVFWSKKKDRLDIFQALCISLNMRSHIDYNKGCVYFNEKHNTTQIQTRHHQPLEKYEGKVYCLETETGAFVVRRNGKAFISGNSGFPKSMNIGLAIDKKNGVESKVVAEGKSGVSSRAYQSEETTTAGSYEIKEAQNEWNGWGTALKPSFEPIIVARKPFKGSCIDNVLKYGVGGINIDECRVGNETISIHNAPKGTFAGGEYGRGSDTESYRDSIGRFPANTILTYNEIPSDERLRYFYCAKASKKDRDEGLENIEATTDKAKGNGLDRICEYCGVSQLTPELCHCKTKSWITKPKKNTHPTVKPTDLMQYLIRLVSPDGATILDPFNGSGSTGKAVMYENKERNKNYKYIGIELTEEYLPIAKARIEYVSNMKPDDSQMNIFDLLEKEDS